MVITMAKAQKTPLPRELMDILACPLCKADLQYNEAKNELFCGKCKRAYPVKDDIPLLLPEV